MKRPLMFSQEAGSVILPFIITLPFLILIATYFMNLSVTSFKLAARDQHHTRAQFAVDGGIDLAMKELNLDSDWAGTGSEVEIFNDGSVRSTYESSVTAVDDDNKIVTVTGRTYRPVSDTTPEASVKIEVDIRAIHSGGSYSLVTGVGGLYMSNSSKIVGGEVFVNGEISLQNTAQIGLSTNPLDVFVAHQNCPNPADASYPQLCGNGENGEPITIQNTAHIYGDVRANNQTDGSNMSLPGLTASSGVSPGALPTHDRDAQKAAATTDVTGSAASCSGSQTRTWAANTKITGNVTVRNSCVVTVQGDVWITGTLSMENTSRMVVADSLGSTRPNIMIDGSSIEFRNSALLQSNSSDTGFQIINYSSDAACSPVAMLPVLIFTIRGTIPRLTCNNRLQGRRPSFMHGGQG
jgi:hypothetical protein